MNSNRFLIKLAVQLLFIISLSATTLAQSDPVNLATKQIVLQPDLPPIEPSGLSGLLLLSGSETFSSAAMTVVGQGDWSNVLIIHQNSDSSLAAAELVKSELGKNKVQVAKAVVRLIALPGDVPENAIDDQFELIGEIAKADLVFITANSANWLHWQQPSLVDTNSDSESKAAATSVSAELRGLIARGGALLVGGSLVSSLGSYIVPPESVEPNIGLSVLPRIMIGKLSSSSEQLSQLQFAIRSQPGHLGIGIDEQSTVVIQGRNLIDLTSTVTVALAESSYRPAELLKQQQVLLDLTQLLRSAEARRINLDPGLPESCHNEQPVADATTKLAVTTDEGCDIGLKSGSLVIVGGGYMPDEIVERFIQLAGGPEAHLIYLPTAVPPKNIAREPAPTFLRKSQVASLTVLPQTGPAQVASEEFQEALSKATGVWFGGGRQWNFVDAYEGTGAVELFRKVLERGGVIGGSSAGATIQGEFLVRGHPLGNTIMMAEGYERGFSFLPGTAIDQHFLQRDRFKDLEKVIRKHRKLLGIGIDEGTALIVQGSTAEVIGSGSVHFLNSQLLDNRNSTKPRELYRSLPAGESLVFESLRKVQ